MYFARRLARLLLAATPLLSGGAAADPMGTDFVPRNLPLSSLLTWNNVSQLPLPPPGERISYGPAMQQFGELRLPEGKGPFPVVVLIHGGCWLAAYGYGYMTHLAAALAKQGIATWTIEYRRLGDADGGWPNTFLDAAAATDFVRKLAPRYPLDLARVAVAGHSAGGQLAMWVAGRPRLPQDSELYMKNPIKLTGVVGLAPITDLAAYRGGAPDSCNASVDVLLGGTPATQATRYAQASPSALVPLGVPQWIVHGVDDKIVPVFSAENYATLAITKGDVVNLTALERTGHFEVVIPQTIARSAVLSAINAALGLAH